MAYAALRRQLTIYQWDQKRPGLRVTDRVFRVFLRRFSSGWDRSLIVVRPKIVVAWQRQGFRLIWRTKSGPSVGRPRISCSHISYIRRISRDHPECGEDRIAEELASKFGIQHAASTSVATWSRVMAP